MIFPGSGLFDKAGPWIVAAEYVKTSQLFARGVANIDPAWLEEIGKDLCTRTYSDPRWEKKQGRVMATEQVSLFGLIIVAGRAVPYGKIHPQEAGDIFIRRALVDAEIHQPFAFMVHNKNLIEELEEAEHKTRQRDILVSTEDMVQFCHARLPRPFYHIKTFAKFLKDQKEDTFLRMTRQDLKNKADQDHLALFPDVLNTAQGNFALVFTGLTRNDTMGSQSRCRRTWRPRSLRRLWKNCAGLFEEEKIAGLIKGLPKSYRGPADARPATAARIATICPKTTHAVVLPVVCLYPETLWIDHSCHSLVSGRPSGGSLENADFHPGPQRPGDHLLRDPSILNRFPHAAPQPGTSALDRARQTFEKQGSQTDVSRFGGSALH